MPIIDFICECFVFAAIIVASGGAIIAIIIHNYREWSKRNYEAKLEEMKAKRKLQQQIAKNNDPLWWV